jgi:cytidine deaminase
MSSARAFSNAPGKKLLLLFRKKSLSSAMREKSIRISYTEYQDTGELPASEKRLADEAVTAASAAYAPYSNFKVGAAIMFEDGTIIRGANVENAAFPSGSCAEKTVISYAVSNFPDKRPLAIAIAALADGEMTTEPVPPCGNCRQMLIEEEQHQGNPIKVILAGRTKTIILNDCRSLMPLSFTRTNLKL